MFYFSEENSKVNRGETLTYKVLFLGFSAGEAKMIIDSDFYPITNSITYKVDVYGKSVGIFDLFTTVRDNWGVYLDTASLKPIKFYQYFIRRKL